jgi:hypothetical protein
LQIDQGPFVIFDNKTVATNLQLFVVLWLIATYGLSYPKSIEILLIAINLLIAMLIAIIDENHMFGQDPSCAAPSKLYSVAFMDLTKKVKAAAGIYILLLCTSMTPDDFRAELRAAECCHSDLLLRRHPQSSWGRRTSRGPDHQALLPRQTLLLPTPRAGRHPRPSAGRRRPVAG